MNQYGELVVLYVQTRIHNIIIISYMYNINCRGVYSDFNVQHYIRNEL